VVVTDSMASSQRLVKEALGGGSHSKGAAAHLPPDGVLTQTPDPPDAEWRNRSVLDTITDGSSFLEEPDSRQAPSQQFGRLTWKIQQFSELGKRELRSSQFDVGEFKWCVVLPGWGCCCLLRRRTTTPPSSALPRPGCCCARRHTQVHPGLPPRL
jgi:hypothetical protein